MMLAACSGRESRVLLDDVASYISERPDSALTVLRSIDTDVLNGKKANAQYALLYSMALDKNVIDVTNDSLISIATNWYDRHGSADESLKAFYYHGRVRQNAGDNEGAMEHFVRAEAFADKAEDDYAKGILFNAMGRVYMNAFDTRKAYEAFISAKECYKRIGDTDKYASELINIARYHISSKDYDEANNLLKEIKSLWDEISWISKQGYFNQSIFLSKQSEDSEKLYTDIYEYLNEIPPKYISWLKISEAYCYLNDYQAALNALENYRLIDNNYASNPAYLISAYELYDSLGWKDQALDAYRDYIAFVNTKTSEIANQDVRFLKERFNKEILIIQKQNTILNIALCFLITIIISMLIIFMIIRRLRIQRADKLRYQEEYSNLEIERDSLRDMIDSNCLVDKETHDVIAKRLSLIDRFFSSTIQADYKKEMKVSKDLEELIENKDTFLHDTRMVFSGIYPKFISFLKEKGLSDSQIEICCLYAIGLKGKDVINYTNRKRHYIDNMDIRLRLGLTEHDQNLGRYLQELFSKAD